MQEGLTVDGALEWIRQSEEQITNGSNVRVAIDRPSRREFLGQVGVGHLDWMNATGEVYYWLAAEARGQGYADAGRTTHHEVGVRRARTPTCLSLRRPGECRV